LSLPLLLAAAVALAGPAVAEASTRSFPDAEDAGGRLDIRSVGHGHAGTKLTHTLVTFGRWPSSLLVGGARVVFQIDTDGSPVNLERTVVVSWRNGALDASVRNAAGHLIGHGSVSRANRRSLTVALAKRLLGNAGGYRWRARTSHQRVTDVAPLTAELHDFTRPLIEMVSFPDPTTRASYDTSFDVEFEVGDAGFSGLADWTLEQRDYGSPEWSLLSNGVEAGSQTAAIDGAVGASYDFRVTARDTDGNVSRAVRTVTVPLDDTSSAFASSYASPPNTSWTFSISDPEDEFWFFYLDTLHSNGFPGATFTYSFTGTHFAWVTQGSASGGSATVAFDGGTPQSVTLPNGCCLGEVPVTRALAPGSHTVVITLTEGAMAIDGIAVR
jgi:hypothetical protein